MIGAASEFGLEDSFDGVDAVAFLKQCQGACFDLMGVATSRLKRGGHVVWFPDGEVVHAAIIAWA